MPGWVFVNKNLQDKWYESSKIIKMQYLIYYTLGRSKLLRDNKALIGGCHLFGHTSYGNLWGEAVLKVVSTYYTYEWPALIKEPRIIFILLKRFTSYSPAHMLLS